jgi:hypothetical protein
MEGVCAAFAETVRMGIFLSESFGRSSTGWNSWRGPRSPGAWPRLEIHEGIRGTTTLWGRWKLRGLVTCLVALHSAPASIANAAINQKMC